MDIKVEISIPTRINRNDNNMFNGPLRLVRNIFMDSGIKSVIDTHIITPLAKARDEQIILLLFLNFMNIGIVPIKVDNPAIEVSKKAIFILFIYITI